MKAKLTILLLALVFVFANEACANQLNQARSLFYQGNSYYSEEEFEQAIAGYEGALTLGLASGALYYNLGNAYFKHGVLGKAVLNYLRARRMIPRDADLKSNLSYAQSLIKVGKIVPQRNWFMRLFFNLAGSFSLNGLLSLSSFLYFALASLVILLITAKRLRRVLTYSIYPLIAALIISATLFFTQFSQGVVQRQAVVIVESADSRFEPFAAATTHFTLYEGESVFVTGAKEDWVRIRRLDGRGGWLKQSDIELL